MLLCLVWLLLVSGEMCGKVVGVRRYRSLQKNANVGALEQRAARGPWPVHLANAHGSGGSCFSTNLHMKGAHLGLALVLQLLGQVDSKLLLDDSLTIALDFCFSMPELAPHLALPFFLS